MSTKKLNLYFIISILLTNLIFLSQGFVYASSNSFNPSSLTESIQTLHDSSTSYSRDLHISYHCVSYQPFVDEVSQIIQFNHVNKKFDVKDGYPILIRPDYYVVDLNRLLLLDFNGKICKIGIRNMIDGSVIDFKFMTPCNIANLKYSLAGCDPLISDIHHILVEQKYFQLSRFGGFEFTGFGIEQPIPAWVINRANIPTQEYLNNLRSEKNCKPTYDDSDGDRAYVNELSKIIEYDLATRRFKIDDDGYPLFIKSNLVYCNIDLVRRKFKDEDGFEKKLQFLNSKSWRFNFLYQNKLDFIHDGCQLSISLVIIDRSHIQQDASGTYIINPAPGTIIDAYVWNL